MLKSLIKLQYPPLNGRHLNVVRSVVWQVMVQYVWIDGTGEHLRAKTKVMNKEPERPEGARALIVM